MKSGYKNNDELPTGMKGADVASYLGISKVTAYKLINGGGFPVIKIGKRVIVPKEAFLKWVENNTAKL